MEHLLQHDIDPEPTVESQPDRTSPKEQKAYEKKLKQYEKEKERYDYFVANKSRLLRNNSAIEKRNTISIDQNNLNIGNNQIKNYGFIPIDKVLTTIDNAIIEIKKIRVGRDGWMDYVKKVNESSIENFGMIINGCELTNLDKKYNFIPKLIGAYGCIYSSVIDKVAVLNLFSIFSAPNLPKKPTPPEKPKHKEIKQQLSELKQEVVQTKEMDRSRKTYGDTIPTKLEVISNGKTITLDKETSDLYIQYKVTRNKRPNDLDLSFDHFKTIYLDKHPQFMRKKL